MEPALPPILSGKTEEHSCWVFKIFFSLRNNSFMCSRTSVVICETRILEAPAILIGAGKEALGSVRKDPRLCS